jgi:hypothetical protein
VAQPGCARGASAPQAAMKGGDGDGARAGGRAGSRSRVVGHHPRVGRVTRQWSDVRTVAWPGAGLTGSREREREREGLVAIAVSLSRGGARARRRLGFYRSSDAGSGQKRGVGHGGFGRSGVCFGNE